MRNDESNYINVENMLVVNSITAFGDVIPLKIKIDPKNFYNHIIKYDFVKYNPRKPIERYGLSLTSLNGGLDGVPDLDSLSEYNRENNTNYIDRDFKTFTEVWYKSEELKNSLKDISDFIFRSHVIKLKPGGVFPIHRDFNKANFDAVRIIIPIAGCLYPQNVFILDGKIIHDWEPGRIYFINTLKEHLLFNTDISDSYWVVFNLEVNDQVARFIHKNFLIS